jgi:hypothetical protein
LAGGLWFCSVKLLRRPHLRAFARPSGVIASVPRRPFFDLIGLPLAALP